LIIREAEGGYQKTPEENEKEFFGEAKKLTVR
jgi:hypothetical protein